MEIVILLIILVATMLAVTAGFTLSRRSLRRQEEAERAAAEAAPKPTGLGKSRRDVFLPDPDEIVLPESPVEHGVSVYPEVEVDPELKVEYEFDEAELEAAFEAEVGAAETDEGGPWEPEPELEPEN
jgi:hypothetical protein